MIVKGSNRLAGTQLPPPQRSADSTAVELGRPQDHLNMIKLIFRTRKIYT